MGPGPHRLVRLAVGSGAHEEYRTLPRDHGEEVGEERALVLTDRIWRQNVAAGSGTSVVGVLTPVTDLNVLRVFDYSRSCEELLAQRISLVLPWKAEGRSGTSRLVFALTRLSYAPRNPERAVSRKACRRP